MKNTLADRLRHAITSSGISQSELARLAGVPQPNLNRFINGHKGVSLETAERLLRAANVTVTFDGRSE